METQNKTTDNGTTEVVFILDRSGSMGGLEKDTIGGFNSMIEKQKKESGNAMITTVIFDTEIDVLHDRLKLDSVPELTEKEYYARGCTALLDAVGTTINRIDSLQKEGIRPAKTLMVITTDGLENSSKNFSYDAVKELIESKKKDGWEFLFLGANIDAVSEAAKIGIERNRAAEFYCDAEGIAENFDAVHSVMECVSRQFEICDNWCDGIESNLKKKKKKQ